jgi:3-oxoadipate enol-lactonase
LAKVRVGDVALEVLDTGGDKPVIAWSHGLLWSHRMFAPQIEALRDRYRCVAWDHRGQGQSDVPPGRIVTIEQVTSDAIALIEQLGLAPVHFVGLSMGGFVGMRIAARRPELVRSLALLATAPDPEPKGNLAKYRVLNALASMVGVTRALGGQVLRIMCGDGWLANPANAARAEELLRMLMENRRTITRAVNGVLERDAVTAELPAISCPTLVLRGTEDQAIPRPRARLLIDGIAGASWVEVPGAGHTLTLETPDPVTAALESFLSSVAGPG